MSDLDLHKLLPRTLIFSGISVIVTLIYLRRKELKSQKSQNPHWQSSDGARQKEKLKRYEKWGPASFPEDYKIAHETRELFTNYAKLNGKPVPNDDEIRLRLKKAYEDAIGAFPFRCIYALGFAYPRVVRHPNYKEIIEKQPKDTTRILELGCCMGTDIRKFLIEGYREQNVLGVDIQKEFINIGIQMFDDHPSFQKRFVICNVLEDGSEDKNTTLKAFISKGVNVVYCSAVYHLLCEQDGHKWTKVVASMLSPGGIYFGSCGGSARSGPILAKTNSQEGESTESSAMQYLHSVNSFTTMLETFGFTNVKVRLVDRSQASWPGRPKNDEPQQDGKGHLCWYAQRK